MAVRWGVAGLGRISETFMDALDLLPDGVLAAVASTDAHHAAAVALRRHVPRHHGSYRDLVLDPTVDAVYVSAVHARHASVSSAAIEAGKPVLCEKPLTDSAAATRALVRFAHDRRVLLMEALWSRFLPAYRELDRLLASGEIGRPLFVEASFGIRAEFDASGRQFDPEQGGGSVLDLGIYPLQLATMVLGAVTGVVAAGTVAMTGVEDVVMVHLSHEGGGISTLQCALTHELPSTASIVGTRGRIDLPQHMHCPSSLRITVDGQNRDVAVPFSNGFQFQIEEFHSLLRAGVIESRLVPHRETTHWADVMDRIRADVLGGVAPPPALSR